MTLQTRIYLHCISCSHNFLFVYKSCNSSVKSRMDMLLYCYVLSNQIAFSPSSTLLDDDDDDDDKNNNDNNDDDTNNNSTYLYIYLLTYLPTHSIKQSPSWEANWFSTSQEIPHILWKPKFHYLVNSTRRLSLSWARSVQSMPLYYFLNIHFNIILPSTSISSKWLLSLKFPNQYLVRTSPLPSAIRATCHAPLTIL